MLPFKRLLLGTANRGKAAEFAELLESLGVELVSLDRAGPAPPTVAETGATLAENAELKAAAYARHYAAWTLADDTSLGVDFLSGAPGLFTARYAGPAATAADNRHKLLTELTGVPLARRTAHFDCQLALADPQGNVRLRAGGACRGRIRLEAAGSAGFGYDALFEVPEYHRTFAELGAAKRVLSHRARAVAALLAGLPLLSK